MGHDKGLYTAEDGATRITLNEPSQSAAIAVFAERQDRLHPVVIN